MYNCQAATFRIFPSQVFDTIYRKLGPKMNIPMHKESKSILSQ